MSTRSTISIINPDLSAKQTFCHWDGYLGYVGEILQIAYDSPRKAAELIRHGDIDHLGFTTKQANLYKDGINMDNRYDKIYKHLGDKADRDYSEITNNYTFYYNRDRHENDETNRPYFFSPKAVKDSWNVAKKWNGKSVKNEFPKANCSVVPGQEYNYIYDASSAHPQWYVTYTKLVDYKPIKKDGVVIGTKGGRWAFCFQLLLTAIHKSNTIKNPSEELRQTNSDYQQFINHPYDPTYKQFAADMKRKYRKPKSSAKPTIKQNFVNPRQMSLF